MKVMEVFTEKNPVKNLKGNYLDLLLLSLKVFIVAYGLLHAGKKGQPRQERKMTDGPPQWLHPKKTLIECGIENMVNH